MLLSGVRSSCDMLARNCDLYCDTRASSCAFSSSDALACGDLAVLDLEQLGALLELLAPLLELDVRALELLEQLLGAHARADEVERDADAEHELLEEGELDRRELVERAELDHAAHLALEEHREDGDVARRRLAEARGDLRRSPRAPR